MNMNCFHRGRCQNEQILLYQLLVNAKSLREKIKNWKGFKTIKKIKKMLKGLFLVVAVFLILLVVRAIIILLF